MSVPLAGPRPSTCSSKYIPLIPDGTSVAIEQPQTAAHSTPSAIPLTLVPDIVAQNRTGRARLTTDVGSSGLRPSVRKMDLDARQCRHPMVSLALRADMSAARPLRNV